jgi:MHS family proline/betaine transporter-like MFS transporter
LWGGEFIGVFFEFAMFGYLAVPLAKLFFPADNEFLSLLMTYMAFACGFFMRPLGALVAGYVGDLYGRKKALILALSLMAVPTALIGCLPTYEQAGILSPVLLILCRLVQGLSFGGEFTGSVIYLMENAPENQRGRYSSLGDLGASFGMILASITMLILTYVLTESQLLGWGWRLPFLSAFLLGIVGLIIRNSMPDTVDFQNLKTRAQNPLKDVFKPQHRASLFLGFLFLTINSLGYYFLIIYVPGVNYEVLPRVQISLMTLLNLLANIPGYMISARLSDRVGQPRVLMIGAVGCFVLAYPTLLMTGETSLFIQIPLQMCFSLFLGFCFGPRSALMARLFPTHVRYTGVSFSYNLSNALLGGTAPMICAFLAHHYDSLMPALYVMVGCVISLISLYLIEKRFT